MKEYFTGFWGVLFLALIIYTSGIFVSGDAFAQRSEFGDFYGEQSIQTVNVRLAPYLLGIDNAGFDAELLFGFNTESKRTENRTKWKYFYGVSLGGGGCGVHDADLGSYGKRDATGGYGFIQLEWKYFENTTESSRPYFGGALGMGSGSIWTENAFTEDDPSGALDLYKIGVEAGTHIALDKGYYLTLAMGVDAIFLFYSGQASTILPVYVSVGVSRWSGLAGN